jgi:diphthamide synthase (EF-2-diphthine--ammonia ligase)
MQLVRNFLTAGFETRIVAVRGDTLPAAYLGRIFSLNLAREFEEMGVDACGENGEFHTVVTNGPLFENLIEILPGHRVYKAGYWFLDFEVRTKSSGRRRGRLA